ncbi:hypothetical protein AB3S75_012397 [Citrus x aurantiifolia]
MKKAVAVFDQTSSGRGPVAGSETSDVGGTVTFSQKENDVLTRVQGSIQGLEPGAHALIVHEFGDIRMGSNSTGGPFKPAAKDGVIANITANHRGKALFDLKEKIPLSEKDSVIGRGLVVHEKPSPDSGDGVGWCIIGLEG